MLTQAIDISMTQFMTVYMTDFDMHWDVKKHIRM